MKIDGVIKQRVADQLVRTVLPTASRYVRRHSLVGDKTFFEGRARFPWIGAFEDSWKVIRDELERVRGVEYIPGLHEITPVLNRLAGDNKWKTFFIVANQDWIRPNCEKCPETTRLLEQVPGLNSAFFSILLPGKHIPAHHGIYNGLLRYHLGLKVPADFAQCAIRVGSDVRQWKEGESLVFDDCFEHEAWNRTEEERVVLIVDFLRPLSFPLSEVNKMIVRWTTQTSYARAGYKKLEDIYHKQ